MGTDDLTRAEIIRIFDDGDYWEHVAMNYVSFIAHYDHGCSRLCNRLAKKLNRVMGDPIALPTTWRKLPALKDKP